VTPKVLRAGTSGHAVPHARLTKPPSHVHSGTPSGGASLSGTPALRLTLGKSAVIAPPHQGGGDTGLVVVATVLGVLALALVVQRRAQAADAPAAAQLGWGPPLPRLMSAAVLTRWRPRRLRLSPLIAGLIALPLSLTGRVRGGSDARLDMAASAPAEPAPTADPMEVPAVSEQAADTPVGLLAPAQEIPDDTEPAGAEAAFALAIALERENDLPGAEDAYRRADALGHPEAAFYLGGMLAEHADFDGALSLYSRADERGHAAGAFNLGVLLEHLNDLAGAEAAYRRGDERGSASAAYCLGMLLAERGDLSHAEAAFRRADERGDADAAFSLGGLFVERDDLPSAEAAYRRADERGHVAGTFNLGVLLEYRGDLAGAEQAYQRAERRGDGEVAEQAAAALLELAAHR